MNSNYFVMSFYCFHQHVGIGVTHFADFMNFVTLNSNVSPSDPCFLTLQYQLEIVHS